MIADTSCFNSNFVISRIILAIMEETKRFRYSFTYRLSFVCAAILAFLHLSMIVPTFMDLQGKSGFQTLQTVLFTLELLEL